MRSPNSVLGCLLLAAVSCSGSAPPPAVIIANSADMSFCGDPAQTPIKVGEFQVQIFAGELTSLEESTIGAELTSVVTRDNVSPDQTHVSSRPIRLSVGTGEPLEIESNTIEVFADHCDFDSVTVSFVAEVFGRRKSDQFLEVRGVRQEFKVTNTCPPVTIGPSPPQLLVETIVGEPVPDFGQYGHDAPTGVKTANQFSSVAPQVPPDKYTETFQYGWVVTDLDQQQLDDAFLGANPSFPLGTGELGLTLEADMPASMVPGRYLLTWQCVEEDIPLGGTQFLQYGFVADRDENSTNNFRAQSPREFEPTDDTDIWYLAMYDGFSWHLEVSDAAGGSPTGIDSAARVVLFGQVQLFVIPVTELDSPDEVLARYFTIAHMGDFGFSLPWSGDATDPVGEPRIAVPLAPSF